MLWSTTDRPLSSSPWGLGALAHLSWVHCDGPICSALGAGTLSCWGPGGGRRFDGSYKPKPKQTQCGKNTRKCHCSPGLSRVYATDCPVTRPTPRGTISQALPPCAHAPCPSCSQGSGLRRHPRRCCTQHCGAPSVGLPELGPGRSWQEAEFSKLLRRLHPQSEGSRVWLHSWLSRGSSWRQAGVFTVASKVP